MKNENLKKGADVFESTVDWEASRTRENTRSKNIAWFITSFFGLITLLAVGALFALVPLKETTPFLVRVDDATGVPDLISSLDETKISFDDVQDKYWLANYVLARESYDWYTLQNDYNKVGLLSTLETAADYKALFEGKESLTEVYGKNITVRVKVLSVVPNGRGTGTVRFTKTLKMANRTPVVKKWVATLAFDYQTDNKLLESDRLINPFGFRVLSYRVDPEF